MNAATRVIMNLLCDHVKPALKQLDWLLVEQQITYKLCLFMHLIHLFDVDEVYDHAAERPFCMCQLLHFCQLLSNPSINSNLSILTENQGNVDSNDVLSVRKYYQIFMHESNTKYTIETIAPMGQTTQKSTPSHWGTWTPSNTWMPGVTPLTIPNDSSIAAHTSAQLSNKVPSGYNGMPQIHPQNCPFPSTITTPHLIHPSLDRHHSPS